MVTHVSAVDSLAYAYPEKVTTTRTTDKTVREPINFSSCPCDSAKTDKATPAEVKDVEKAEEEYQEDKKNILQKFADKMKKIFSKPEDIAIGAGEGALGGGIVGGLLGLLLKGGLKGFLKGGAAGAILGLLGIGTLALIGKIFDKDAKVEEKPTLPQEKPEDPTLPQEKPKPRVYEIKKGDNIWNIAKADLIEKHKDDPNYKVTNAKILARTNEIMELNKNVNKEDKKAGFVDLKWEKDHYHVMIRPGDKIKLDPEVVEEEVQKQLAVA